MKLTNWIVTGTLLLAIASLGKSESASAPDTQARLVVTLEPKHGKDIPSLTAQDISVTQDKARCTVTGLTPAGQNGQTMQLLILLDDSSRESLDTNLSTLKQFVTGLPQTTEVAIGYMRNGTNQMVANFTRDHASAASAIRLVVGSGGADVSPYDSLSEAVKRWPAGAERREVIMISSGIEGLGGGFTPDNPYVNRGIADAQRAGVVVYTIYNPSVGHAGHAFWRENWGQSFLSQLSDETGGEFYGIGFGSPVSIEPYLQQILQQMQNQYILTFETKAQKKTELQPVKVRITEKNASIAAADKILVRAGL